MHREKVKNSNDINIGCMCLIQVWMAIFLDIIIYFLVFFSSNITYLKLHICQQKPKIRHIFSKLCKICEAKHYQGFVIKV